MFLIPPSKKKNFTYSCCVNFFLLEYFIPRGGGYGPFYPLEVVSLKKLFKCPRDLKFFLARQKHIPGPEKKIWCAPATFRPSLAISKKKLPLENGIFAILIIHGVYREMHGKLHFFMYSPPLKWNIAKMRKWRAMKELYFKHTKKWRRHILKCR